MNVVRNCAFPTTVNHLEIFPRGEPWTTSFEPFSSFNPFQSFFPLSSLLQSLADRSTDGRRNSKAHGNLRAKCKNN